MHIIKQSIHRYGERKRLTLSDIAGLQCLVDKLPLVDNIDAAVLLHDEMETDGCCNLLTVTLTAVVVDVE